MVKRVLNKKVGESRREGRDGQIEIFAQVQKSQIREKRSGERLIIRFNA